LKALTFVLLGFATPLAIWRFDSLGLGVLFAFVATVAIEACQFAIAGHSAHVLECLAKLGFVFLGFAVGLNVRYERRANLPFLRIQFLDPHRRESS
jgi:Kef-type K+ transport system membrane component KefB